VSEGGTLAGLRRLLGTALGLGYLPKAPGTWASLATVLAFGGLLGVEGWGPGLWPRLDGAFSEVGGVGGLVLALGVAVVIKTVVGVWIGGWAEADHGRKDPGSFVLDEVVGQAIPILGLLVLSQPEGATDLAPLPPLGLAVAFVAFRVFDILKPPPVRQVERLPAGVGIMADDVVAGLYALLIVVAVA